MLSVRAFLVAFVLACAFAVCVVDAQEKVSVMAFEMSKCPHCSAWKQAFNSSVMSAEGLPAIIDLKEYFVGDRSGTNFTCYHGPSECVGNEILLCAYNLTSATSQWGWWNMGVCMQADYTNVPQNAASCAQKAGLNWAQINGCVNSALGPDLFAQSIAYSDKMRVQSTPTIFIASREYVGGPSDPLRTICDAYKGTKPKGCM
eukprot:TRINITY_DN1606_c0_g1_i2.p1 TRINITY_DN1606_c0_g1~~TRINITY_DN1606_c0_g1_i2.p1  ORF type:complete len:217 (+),score=51.50 TRINITY_DN1606_c0_g1_i2:46-651(+)